MRGCRDLGTKGCSDAGTQGSRDRGMQECSDSDAGMQGLGCRDSRMQECSGSDAGMHRPLSPGGGTARARMSHRVAPLAAGTPPKKERGDSSLPGKPRKISPHFSGKAFVRNYFRVENKQRKGTNSSSSAWREGKNEHAAVGASSPRVPVAFPHGQSLCWLLLLSQGPHSLLPHPSCRNFPCGSCIHGLCQQQQLAEDFPAGADPAAAQKAGGIRGRARKRWP